MIQLRHSSPALDEERGYFIWGEEELADSVEDGLFPADVFGERVLEEFGYEFEPAKSGLGFHDDVRDGQKAKVVVSRLALGEEFFGFGEECVECGVGFCEEDFALFGGEGSEEEAAESEQVSAMADIGCGKRWSEPFEELMSAGWGDFNEVEVGGVPLEQSIGEEPIDDGVGCASA